jgi:hypothetical protein
MNEPPPTSPDELHLCVFESNVDAHPRAALARSLTHCMSQRLTTATQKRYDGLLYGPGADLDALRAVRCAKIASVDQLLAWAGADLSADQRAHTIKSLGQMRSHTGYATPSIELVLEACPEAALAAAIAAVDAPLGPAPPPWVARALDGLDEPRLALSTSVSASRRSPVEWTRAFTRRRAQFRRDVSVDFHLDANKLELIREAIELLSASEIHGVQLSAHHRKASIEPLVDSLPEGLRRFDVGEPSIAGMQALKRCSALRSVRDLGITTTSVLDDALDDFGVAFEQLESLRYASFAPGSVGALRRLCATGRLVALAHLRMYGSTISDADIDALAAATPASTLRTLELTHAAITAKGAAQLAADRAFSKVESLSVRPAYDQRASSMAIEFVRACQLRSLSSFEWDDFKLSPEQARSIIAEVTTNASFAQLRSLKLTQLGDAALDTLAAASPAPKLARVELSTVPVSDRALIAALRSSWLTNVRSLSLSASMTEPALLALCSSPALSGLESLQLAPRQLTARFASALREASFARSLRQLTLFSGAADDDAAAVLCDEALQTQLWRLTLTRKVFAPDARWALERAYGPALNLI